MRETGFIKAVLWTPNPVPQLSGGLLLYCGQCIRAGPRCLPPCSPGLTLDLLNSGNMPSWGSTMDSSKEVHSQGWCSSSTTEFHCLVFFRVPISQVLTKHNWRNNDGCGQLSKEAVYFMKWMTQFKYNHRTTRRQKGLREIKHFFKKMACLAIIAPIIGQLMLVKDFSWAGHFTSSIALLGDFVKADTPISTSCNCSHKGLLVDCPLCHCPRILNPFTIYTLVVTLIQTHTMNYVSCLVSAVSLTLSWVILNN